MEIIILSIGILALAVTSIIVLAIVIYNQMLMVNEINKRLLLIAQEAQDKERITMAELQQALERNLDPTAPVVEKQPVEDTFNPFDYKAEEKDNDL
jgi:hypothetical protein